MFACQNARGFPIGRFVYYSSRTIRILFISSSRGSCSRVLVRHIPTEIGILVFCLGYAGRMTRIFSTTRARTCRGSFSSRSSQAGFSSSGQDLLS